MVWYLVMVRNRREISRDSIHEGYEYKAHCGGEE